MSKFLFAIIMLCLPELVIAQSQPILVLGDSISAGYGLEVSQGWVSILEKKLIETNRHYSIINASISGETSAGGLSRLNALLSTHKPSIILVQLGANDGLRGLSPVQMKNNLSEIVHLSQQSGAKVILLAMKIPPNYGKRYVEQFYAVYPQLAQALTVQLVPFILEDVALNKDLMQADGLHPNAKAQSILADKIEPYLFPLLK
jgi:acyl-CoA thioesterase-1